MAESGRLLVVSHPAVLKVNQAQYAAMQELGWELTLVVPAKWKHEYRSDRFSPATLPSLAGAVQPHRVVMAGLAQRHFYLARPSTIIQRAKPDVVFLEQEPFSICAAQWGRAAARLGIPFGVQADENLDRPMPLLARLIRSRVLSAASFVVARSPAAADLVRRWGFTGRVDVIPHPVPAWPLEPEHGPQKDTFVIGFAGRLVPEKGVADLLEAFTKMRQPARLLLVGNGPLLKTVVGQPGVEVWSNCPHERMAEAYQRMDVLVLPSRRTPEWEEQFGRVLVEALHCAVPVIGSATGEIPWVVESTGGGWLFPEGDVDCLAALLDRLVSDPVDLIERARQGQRVVSERFSEQAVASRMSEVITDVRDRHRKPRLTLVAHDVGGVGGMERIYGELVQRLAQGWEIHVVSVTLEESLRRLVHWEQVRIPSRPAALKFALFFVLAGLALGRKRDGIVNTCGAIVPNHVDIISVHHCHAGVFQATGRRSPSGAPLLRRLNTGAAHLLASMAERWSYRNGHVRMLHAGSSGLARELRSHFPGLPVSVVPNGVDLFCSDVSPLERAAFRRDCGASEDSLVALFLGGDWDRKGLRLAIEAVALARQTGADVRLWVVGKGNANRFRVVAATHGVDRFVNFLGRVPELSPIYRAADLFLLPSGYESFSIPAHEAAAHGLPVLSTAVHGVADLIGADEAGILLGSDPSEWAQALVRLAGDAQLRARLGSEGRRRVSTMGWAETAQGFEVMARALLRSDRYSPT